MSLFEDLESLKEKIHCETDILAMSCYLHRNKNTYIGLERAAKQSIANVAVSNEDHELAYRIRYHYSTQLSVEILSNKPLSSFRSSLIDFLKTDGRSFDKSQLGMITSLPSFYEYDKKLEWISHQFNLYDLNSHRGKLSLYFVDSLTKKNRGIKREEFWFKVKDTDHPVLLTVNQENVLLNFWKKYLDKDRHILLDGWFSLRTNSRNFPHLLAEKWTMA